AMRVGGSSTSALGSPRVFLATLAPGFSPDAGKIAGPIPADGGPAGSLGMPDVAASDEGGGEGGMRLTFSAGASLRQIGVDEAGQPTALPLPGEPAPTGGAEALSAVDPGGGGLLAWAASDSNGRPVLAVRQEAASGAAQTALLAATGGPLSE